MRKELTIKELVLKHRELYPKMQVQDMVKLLYQNEFAGGHLIADEEESLRRLWGEYASLAERPAGQACANRTFVEIGNGLCRLDLAVLKEMGFRPETVNRFFVNTANSVSGNIERFEAKLEILRKCCREYALPFSAVEQDEYLLAYRSKGYPSVHHSAVYQGCYSPAYRVVKQEYADYLDIFSRIDGLLEKKKSVNVAIDGNCGAGKSSLAALISGVYRCNVFHTDDYFLSPEQKTEERLAEVGGNVDYERFSKEVLEGLRSGDFFTYRVYDCKLHSFRETIRVIPQRINIIEGSYSMHPALADAYDLKIFLSISQEEQAGRILERNGPALQKRFISEWIPLENEYFEKLSIPQKCDLVFDC